MVHSVVPLRILAQVPYDLQAIAQAQGKPFYQGEYGGWSSAVAGHQWNTSCGRVERRGRLVVPEGSRWTDVLAQSFGQAPSVGLPL